MGRKRQYSSAAERLRAFRARLRDHSGENPAPAPQPRPKQKASRPARLEAIENEARCLIDEYQGWRGSLPEPLQESGLAAKLDEAIDKLTEAAELLADVELPKGFGRD